MPLSFYEFKREISREIPAVLVIGGEEAGFVAETKKHVIKHVVEGPMRDLNHDRVNAKEKEIAEVLQLAHTLPMMAPRRLIEISNAEMWGKTPQEIQMFMEYCQSPCQDAVLLLLMSKMDMRQKWLKMLDKHATLGRFKAPSEKELPDLTQNMAKEMGLKIDDDAIDALMLCVGTDTLMMRRALEKLEIACVDGRVNVSDVSAHVANTRMEDAFALGRAVIKGERKEALTYLYRLKQNRAVPLKLLGMLAWQLRQVSQARAFLDDGHQPGEIAKELRLFGNRFDPVIRAARKAPLIHHTKRTALLADLDSALKTSAADSWLHLEKAILRLCPHHMGEGREIRR